MSAVSSMPLAIILILGVSLVINNASAFKLTDHLLEAASQKSNHNQKRFSNIDDNFLELHACIVACVKCTNLSVQEEVRNTIKNIKIRLLYIYI